MDVELRPEDGEWRKRGRPATQVPQEIVDALLRTYNSGVVGVVRIGSDMEYRDAMAHIVLMRRAARQMGCRMAFQPAPAKITTVFRFRMMDKA